MEYFFSQLADAFIPVSIVVVLPVLIVWLVTRWKTNRDDKRAEILMKAVELNAVQDVDKILGGLPKHSQSMKEVMLRRLLLGCAFMFIGITLLLIGLLSWCIEKWFNDTALFCMIAGGISVSIGLAYLVVYRVTRKMLDSEDKPDEE